MVDEVVVRRAEERDLDRIAMLTRGHRDDLARWGPTWWRKAEGADELHHLWLRHLVVDTPTDVRVLEVDDEVVGCAAVVEQPGSWFVDDLCVVEEHWPGAGRNLLESVEHRPARTCCATGDKVRAEALRAASLTRVSSYWIAPPSPGEAPQVASVSDPAALPPPPPHTFGGALDPAAEGALAFELPGGVVVGSPSTNAPPVYDPGGPVCVVDRVVGGPRGDLIDAASALSARRGDALLGVVAGSTDDELERLLDSRGFDRTVDVYAWP